MSMKIILSPAKQMREEPDIIAPVTAPVFLDKTAEIMRYMRSLSYAEAKKLWQCNDKIARENYTRFSQMDLSAAVTPSILSYDGIAFKYMAPTVFEDDYFNYVQEHLRILSGFYGVLKPLDAVVPYRLEMQAKAHVAGTKNLYEYWGRTLYDEIAGNKEAGDHHRTVIVNLASKEYSMSIEEWMRPEDHFLTCVFGELEGIKIVQKGVYAKMARGDMVRFMAENQIDDPEELRGYNRMGYSYREDLSAENEYVFIKAGREQ